MKGEQEKKSMMSKSVDDKESLKKTCIESFKDIYSTYAHIKVPTSRNPPRCSRSLLTAR